MKNLLKVCCLVGGVFGLGVFSFIVRGEEDPFSISWNRNPLAHKVSLTDLWIGENLNNLAWLKAGENNLDVLNGIVAGSGNNVEGSIVLSSIGGGENNEVGGNYAGVVGGSNNIAGGSNSAIGGGDGNISNGSNAVVAGGNENKANSDGGVILGGKGNSADGEYGIVLGGSNNKAGKYGLSLGRGSSGGNQSFSWSDSESGEGDGQPLGDSAHIGATSGVLIGTYNPIPGVNLVVNGAVKIEGGAGDLNGVEAGEIRMIQGCVFAYDGNNWHILGKNSNESDSCKDIIRNTGGNLAGTCNFGETMLWEGDTVTGYNSPYGNCDSNRCDVVCQHDGSLRCDNDGGSDYIYPYCYSLSPEG